ncbi:MBL fold metallo-hydrolase [Rhodohalobacter halophilus]|uniref:MBL fold metallo-hydrolase n=1 Tax=Rhodohalobacter halophilus TaxID=1812810 RepID=UPI00083F7F23|nr:MBL fold metallo-hydrolase [Rhodohalobacter halophilus]
MSRVHVTPLYEGTFSVGLDKDFKRINRDDPPNQGALKLSINPFLIQDGDRNILFDVGLGDLFGADTSIDTILENLEEQDVEDFEITDIFASHLHFDHIGGLAHRKNGYWELTFPEAKVWVSGQEWEKLRSIIDNKSEDEIDFFNFLDAHADLGFLKQEGNPIEYVRTKTIGGHTEFHQALFYENGENKFIMAGDVVGRRSAINRTFEAKYDFDPQKSSQNRKELQKVAYKEGYTFLTYHETDHPMFKLTGFDENKGYIIENVS